MKEIIVEQQSSERTVDPWTRQQDVSWRWYIIPLVASFAIDLLTSQFVKWHLLPGTVRWASDAAIAAIVVMLVMRMLLLDRIPAAFLLVLFASSVGVTVALFEGQSVGATMYGWWRVFAYPLVGLFVYMMPTWPSKSATWLMRGCLMILGFEVMFQIGQYTMGQEPGDFLAGTLGPYGVGPLIMFILITIALGFGRWLQFGEWQYLIVALVLGTISSALGEMKLYVGGVFALASITVVVHLFRGRQIRQLLMFLAITALAIAAYFFVFDYVFRDIMSFRFQEYFTDPSRSIDYLSHVNSTSTGYVLGRLREPIYAWQQIQGDAIRLLFGRGIGSDATSDALGFSGVAVASSLYRGGVGRSLRMFILESGIIGLTTLATFFIIVSGALYRRANQLPGTEVGAMQYGLMVFTMLWPLWLWYQPVWVQAVPMLAYWTLLGYSLNQANWDNQHESSAA